MGITYGLMASTLWGGMYVVSRYSFPTIPPITLALTRLVLGSLVLYTGLRIACRNRGFSQDVRTWVLLAILVATALVTQFVGTDLTSAGMGALLTTTTPLFVAIFAKLLLNERLGRGITMGIGLATLGSMLVLTENVQPTVGPITALGSLLLLVSACLWALYTVLGKPVAQRVSALTATTYSSLLAIPLILPLIPIELSARPVGTISPDIMAGIVYLGVGSTALAWWLWYKALESARASVVGVTFFAQPVAGGILAWVLLDERPTTQFIIGALLIASGVLLSSRGSRTDSPPQPYDPPIPPSKPTQKQTF